MSLRLRHQTDSEQIKKTIWLGPPNQEQQPKLCSRCGKPVALAYRTLKREFDTKKGEWRVAKGQFEVAHIQDNRPVFDICPFPSLLEQLQARIERERAAAESRELQEGDAGAIVLKSRTVHLGTDQREDGTFGRVNCGARGSLYISIDTAKVTCYNCKSRVETNAAIQNVVRAKADKERVAAESLKQQTETKGRGENMSATQATTNKPKAMTKEQIQAKIAAAKASKAAPAGTSAELMDDGAPAPKATAKKAAGGVVKQAVQSAKAPKGPKLLNLCGCGCGEAVKSNFKPGHDARLHGWIKKLAAGAMSLSDLAAQVRDGMYKGVKQQAVKDGEGNVTLAGVEPSLDEASYLEMLKGKGGVVEAEE